MSGLVRKGRTLEDAWRHVMSEKAERREARRLKRELRRLGRLGTTKLREMHDQRQGAAFQQVQAAKLMAQQTLAGVNRG